MQHVSVRFTSSDSNQPCIKNVTSTVHLLGLRFQQRLECVDWKGRRRRRIVYKDPTSTCILSLLASSSFSFFASKRGDIRMREREMLFWKECDAKRGNREVRPVGTPVGTTSDVIIT